MKNRLLKNHVLRPLMVVILLVIVFFIVRAIYVPDDFGAHGSFTYNYYRQSNIQDWEDVTVKYQGREYCNNCHEQRVEQISVTPHSIIQCENCHGPGLGHPEIIPTLAIGDSQSLCLRCHAELPYAASGRSRIVGIDPNAHGLPGKECVDCHNPHNPTNLPNPDTAGPTAPTTPNTGGSDAAGLFAEHCAGCHSTMPGAGLTASQAADVIRDGFGGMPGFAGVLTPEQIEQLGEYVTNEEGSE
jgi:ribosomal protein L37AE/L43A